MAGKNYEYLEKRINELSDRLYEAEGNLKLMDDRMGKMIVRLLDCEEMIEQLSSRRR